MTLDIKQLPDDPEKLKNIISDIISELSLQHEDIIHDYENKLKEEKFRYQILEEKFKILRSKFFKSRSEKLSDEEKLQMRLFNETEEGVDSEEPEESGSADKIIVKGYTRGKRGRKPLPDDLPREEVIHDLSDEEKQCPCCGEARPAIGKEETEELDIIPAQIKVIKHIRMKYGPCACGEFLEKEIPEVKIAPMPLRMIPQSIVSPGLLAYILTSKFVDALPFYRQTKMFERINVDISRATMCNWAILAAQRCIDLISIMREEIRSGPLIQMDETTVQVLKEPGREPTAKSYMWVTVGYPQPDKPVILFDYRPTRSQNIPLDLLKGYEGYLQTDGYGGYNAAGNVPGIIHIGCFAHARRYFHDAFTLNKKSNTAQRGLSYIQKLYKVEHDLRDKKLLPEDFAKQRRILAEPVLNEFHNWLNVQKEAITPESKLGKAIHYSLNEWHKLIRYLDAPFLRPDNNAVEQSIRPFVIGRKNWLFSNTPRGAESSAVIYSLVQTARANNIEPYHYLRFLFTYLPAASSVEDLMKLLPTNIQPDNIR